MDCQSFRQGCCGCCVNMRWQPERTAAFLDANTRAAERLFCAGVRPGYFDLVRLHLARGGWRDHLLAAWLVPLTFGLSAWLWKRRYGSCCFAGYLDRPSGRVGCLIHPLRVGGRGDLRKHAFPLIPTVGCNRALRCPMLDAQGVSPAADWLAASRDGAASLQGQKRGSSPRRHCARRAFPEPSGSMIMKRLRFALWFIVLTLAAHGAELPDIRSVEPDLTVPVMTADAPAAGRRVKRTLAAYQGTEVYHALYLPRDWRVGKRFPVIVEYAGNGSYSNRFGDVCDGRVESGKLGYGASGGKGFIWVCAPYISPDRTRNQPQWWGDVEATVGYCTGLVAEVCATYGGDPSAVFLAGFSRGSIACNYIGLHDDAIAALWRGFLCHSHYDGVRAWPYAGSDRAAAAVRLARLKGRPQFVSHEGSPAETQAYLKQACPEGRFTFVPLPYRNHTDAWTLRDIPERAALREWLAKTVRAE